MGDDAGADDARTRRGGANARHLPRRLAICFLSVLLLILSPGPAAAQKQATALEHYAARLEAVAAAYPQLQTILSDAFAHPNGREAAVHPLRLLRGLLILFAAGTAALLLTGRALAGPKRRLEAEGGGAPLLAGLLRFVLGLVPLVFATGAAMLSRRAVGTAVFGGMIGAAVIGIFVIPMLYVVFQTMREGTKRMFGRKAPSGEH